MIDKKQKLIFIISVVASLSIFFAGKSVLVAYGQTRVVGGLIFSPISEKNSKESSTPSISNNSEVVGKIGTISADEIKYASEMYKRDTPPTGPSVGYFMADNSNFGGPGNLSWYNSGRGWKYGETNLHTEGGCTNCIDGDWIGYSCSCGKNCTTTCYYWVCKSYRLGNYISGGYSEDSACKAVYGSNVRASINTLNNDVTINICGNNSANSYRVECVEDIPPPIIPPPPLPGSSCAWWQGGDSKSGVCEKANTSLFQGGSKALGDISVNPGQFVLRIFTIILSFAGGIAFLLIISAGYKIITSSGKPEGIQQGHDQLMSAIIGLVFIIFSLVIFNLVVVDIFKIPGITQ